MFVDNSGLGLVSQYFYRKLSDISLPPRTSSFLSLLASARCLAIPSTPVRRPIIEAPERFTDSKSVYPYNANKGAPIFFAVLFAVSTVYHIYQNMYVSLLACLQVN